MSVNNIVLINGQQATINYDITKIFVWENRFLSGNYSNDTYNDQTLVIGTPMGRIAANGQIRPAQSNSSDGSQNIIGILAADVVVSAGALVSLPMCIGGDVIADQLVFPGGDSLDTVLSARQLRDHIEGNTTIRLIVSTQLTGNDNS